MGGEEKYRKLWPPSASRSTPVPYLAYDGDAWTAKDGGRDRDSRETAGVSPGHTEQKNRGKQRRLGPGGRLTVDDACGGLPASRETTATLLEPAKDKRTLFLPLYFLSQSRCSVLSLSLCFCKNFPDPPFSLSLWPFIGRRRWHWLPLSPWRLRDDGGVLGETCRGRCRGLQSRLAEAKTGDRERGEDKGESTVCRGGAGID